MRTDDFDYELPSDLIAQTPASRRDDARLLVVPPAGPFGDRTVHDLPDLLREGDLLIVNDTRVLPARLDARRDTGGRVEVFLLEPGPDDSWTALLRSGGRPRPGEALTVGGAEVELVERREGGVWLLRAARGDSLASLAEQHGRMPLPPYIERALDDPRDAEDRVRYQTVYARALGAVAAPTAGLHLTDALLDALAARGVRHAAVTLHVGLGTFAPVRVERIEEHPMHAERFFVPAETAALIRIVFGSLANIQILSPEPRAPAV